MRVLGLLALVGCGRIDFAAHAPDAAAPDACTWSVFSTPQPLPATVQSTGDDWGPTPTLGATDIYFYSFRAGGVGGADIWHTVMLGTPQVVSELDTTDDERAPTLTEDGLMVVISRSVQQMPAELFVATRANPTDLWSTPTPIAELNGPGSQDDPWLSADGLRILFASSTRSDTVGGLDIYEATRASRADVFGPPVHFSTLATAVDDISPTLTADGLDIYFASYGLGGPGGADVYTAHRPALDQPFGAPTLVPELSSPRDDVNLRLSPDGTTMYVNYNAITSGGGNADLDVATRTCN